MENKVTITIEKLDYGCIVTENNTKRAKENTEDARKYLIDRFTKQIERLTNVAIRDLLIEIIVEENYPKCINH